MEVPRIDAEKLTRPEKGEKSGAVRERVQAAQEIQKRRFRGTGIALNAEMSVRDLEQFCRLSSAQETLAREIIQKLELSARAYHRGLRVARTIADLEGAEEIGEEHLMEAFGYRVFLQDPRRQEE